MDTIKKGSKGAEVKKLQTRLKELGFNPGKIDSSFGKATLASLIAYQKSAGLLPDGIAGPRTLHSLCLIDRPVIEDELSKFTVEKVSLMFPNTPVKNIKLNLPFVLDGLRAFSLTDKPMALMALATIRAETESFRPINEMKSKWNSSPNGHPFDLYDNRKDLGNTGRPDGELFKGRGFIQLTGRANYEYYSKKLKLGKALIENPDLANEPETAAKLLALFLKDKEIKIKEALLENDYKGARKLVNGGSFGLDNFINAFEKGNNIIS